MGMVLLQKNTRHAGDRVVEAVMKRTALLLFWALAVADAGPWPDTVVATVSTGQYPNDACFSPDGGYVFVAPATGT
jgi:hypothetical protein